MALAFTSSYEYDAIILDLMLPGIDGLTVLKTLRQRRCMSYVLILSARHQTEDRIRGLDLGADDYMIKPFSFEELVSRLNALSRRQPNFTTNILSAGELKLDTGKRLASLADEAVMLTPTEYALLEYLVRRVGRPVSHQQLIDGLYDASRNVSRNALEAHMSSLRRKLKDAGARELITTRRGFGYVIEVT